ncbi:MAG: hypothetical protein PF690_02065 [Deltaproteobacteria bacterium]|jgi:hypothetical protein|nr:hypothetical protein [Deltaproteobacteria bacterium]
MGATLLKKNLPEEIYKQFKKLNKKQVSQVLDFIEFLTLKQKKGLRRNPLIEFITTDADPEMTLHVVRQQLSGIKGNLADTIIKGREERV